MMRVGLAQFLNQQEGIRVCGEAADGIAALAGVQQTQPDLSTSGPITLSTTGGTQNAHGSLLARGQVEEIALERRARHPVEFERDLPGELVGSNFYAAVGQARG